MMKTLTFFTLAAFGVFAEVGHNLTLEEVYGEVDRVEFMAPWHKRSGTRQHRSEEYFARRAADECDFALEIYILQDNTASFQDNYAEMKNTQIPLLVEAMNAQHPGTKFGIMSFRDKPIWSLGEPRSNDYCQRFESPLSADDSLLTAVYESLISTGGGDPSENQFGALLAASQSSSPGWVNPDAVKLIVLATDAPPHFEGDGLNAYGLTKFDGVFDEENAAAQCLATYYPTPEQVKHALEVREAYLATIVFDGEWNNGLPSRSWIWFNSYIGQTDDFVEPLGNDSTGFFESLSKVIESLKDIECYPESTEIPATADEDTTPILATEVPSTIVTAASTTEALLTTSTAQEWTSTVPTTEAYKSTTNSPTQATEVTSTENPECPPCVEEPCVRPPICNEGVVININVGFNPHNFEVKNGGQGFSKN